MRDYFHDTLRFWADLGVDGFRVDVAHSLAKDLTDPLRSQPNLDQMLPLDGTDPLYDREELHEIYRGWRAVFNEYDPPRMAVAETWYPTTSRTYLYARPTELGQVFDFSLLKAQWNRDEFEAVIRRSINEHRTIGGGLTWVLSSHDVPRHASRYGLPPNTDLDTWLSGNGTHPPLDPLLGRQRARAATLMMLALPGSAYLYQGEELGLLEVADLTPEQIRDPVYERTAHALKGRDGCRVPLPWTCQGTSFGFGSNGSWLPQPTSSGEVSVEAQQDDPESSLSLYREALAQRQTWNIDDGGVTWRTADPGLLHFARGNGWECAVNFAESDRAVPPGQVVLSSAAIINDKIPPNTAVWLIRTDGVSAH